MNRNITLLLAITFAKQMMFAVPIIVLLMQNRAGLTFGQFMLTESLFAITMLAFDMPAGRLSDLWCRKHTLTLGLLMETAAWIMFLLADSFWDVAIAQILGGIGCALGAATLSALFYDSLLAAGREGEHRRLEGLRHGFFMYGVAFASIIGGVMASMNETLPLVMTVIIMGFGLILTLLIVEPDRQKAAHGHDRRLCSVLHTLVWQDRPVFWMLLACAATFGATKLLFFTQQAYFQHIGLPVLAFGLFAAIGQIMGGIAGQLGHKFDHKLRTRDALIGLTLFLSAALILCLALPGWFGAICIVMGACVYGFGWPIVLDSLHRRVDSRNRATLIALLHMGISLTFIPMGNLLGMTSDMLGLPMAIGGLIGFLLCVALPLCLAFRHTTNQQKHQPEG